jgi:hypothetical protein
MMCMVETQCERNVHKQEYGEQTDRRSGRQSIATSRDVEHDEKQVSVTLSTRYWKLCFVVTKNRSMLCGITGVVRPAYF